MKSVNYLRTHDSINDRHCHHGVISVDRGKKWRKPIFVDFAVSIEVHDDLASRFSCASEKSHPINIESILF